MPSDPSRFNLNIEAGPDADDQERIDLARRLRTELMTLSDVESIDSPPISVNTRSKAPGVDWQTLVVTLTASGGVLTTLIGTVQAWLTRHERTSVTLEVGGDELVITGASSESQNRLVQGLDQPS